MGRTQRPLTRDGVPEIFNSYQGSQFTSRDLTSALEARGVAISMDGGGRWVDNVLTKHFWRSLKYEHMHLHAYADLSAAQVGIGAYTAYYNGRQRHSSLSRRTPAAACADEAQGEFPFTRRVRSSGARTPANPAGAHLSETGALSKT